MNIYICFNEQEEGKLSKKFNLNGSIYNYVYEYYENGRCVEMCSSKKLSEKEINSLGTIFFNDKSTLLDKGYIDLIIDKYIINKNERW